MDRHEGLFRLVLRACAPLLVWAAHFTFCYLYSAAVCRPEGGAAGAWWLQLGASAAALGVVAWLFARSCRAAQGSRVLRHFAALASGALALAGVAWSSIAILLAGGCF